MNEFKRLFITPELVVETPVSESLQRRRQVTGTRHLP